MAILKVEALLAIPLTSRSGKGVRPCPFFMWPYGVSLERLEALEGKTSAGKTLSEAYRFTFYDIIGTRKGFDSDWTVIGQ